MKDLNKSFVGLILVFLLIFTSIPIVQAEDTSYFDKMPTILRRLMEDFPDDVVFGDNADSLCLYFTATDAEKEFEKMGLDLERINATDHGYFRVSLTESEIILLAKDERTITFTYYTSIEELPYMSDSLSASKIQPHLQTAMNDAKDYEKIGEQGRFERFCMYVTPTDPQMTQQEVEEFYKSYTAELGIDWEDVWFCTPYGCIGVSLTKSEISRLAEDDRVLNFYYNDIEALPSVDVLFWSYTASDALAILQGAVGKGGYNYGPLYDNNRDGVVDSEDALRALQDSVGKIEMTWSRNDYYFPELESGYI